VINIERHKDEYVTKQNGTPYGYIFYTIIHKIVLIINDKFPTTVYTPPHPVL
jgi:hypothetical protein